MSKAFTREENEGPEFSDLPARESILPEGARNYLTPEGAARLREELAELIGRDRPRLLDHTDDPEAKRQLARVNERIFQLEQSLQSAEIRGPIAGSDQVGFGSTVRVRETDGEERPIASLASMRQTSIADGSAGLRLWRARFCSGASGKR